MADEKPDEVTEAMKELADYTREWASGSYKETLTQFIFKKGFAQGKLAERKEITELMVDILSQACYEKDETGEDVYFSRALSAYADGLKWLVETGKYEHIYKPVGRMVKIRLKSQLSKDDVKE
jgi:hypothetical protein